MTPAERVERFRGALDGGENFVIESTSPYGFDLRSDRCLIRFHFERYPEDDNSYIIFIQRPGTSQDLGMHLWILRQIFGARAESGLNTPEALAENVNQYFGDLIGGDFRRENLYRRREGEVLDAVEAARSLPEDHPIQAKIRRCDSSWLADIKALKRSKGWLSRLLAGAWRA